MFWLQRKPDFQKNDQELNVEFKPITDFRPGEIQILTKKGYYDLIGYFPDERDRLYRQWENNDKLAFQNITL